MTLPRMAVAIGRRVCAHDRKMLEAAARSGRVLSVAENFRRDPSSRLVHHLLRSGAIVQDLIEHVPSPFVAKAGSGEKSPIMPRSQQQPRLPPVARPHPPSIASA